MAEIDLKEKFPDLEVGRSPGVLFRLNGIGFGMYGHRDEDRETGTYVKTWCLSFLFLPVLALRAYRVADADRGWRFLGRVPLSRIATACNLLVLVGLLCLGGSIWWGSRTSTPEVRAHALAADAQADAERGEYKGAAQAWKQAVLLSGTVAGEVVEGVRGILDREMTAEDALQVYTLAAFLQQRPQGPRVAEDLGPRGLAQMRRCAATDPRGALAIGVVVAPFVSPEELAALRRDLLAKIVEREPGDFPAAVRLAALCEADGDPGRCIALLEPHRARLADSGDASSDEGARILGHAYAARDRYEDAFAILSPLVDRRLEELQRAGKELDEATKKAEDRELQRLQAGHSPSALDHRVKDAATDEQRHAIIKAYLSSKAEEDATVRQSLAKMRALRDVVPAALDLGRVRMRRAQAMADPDTRRSELEAAEKTLLSVRSFAAKSDPYRLLLGQVRCLLGRGKEGHALFDELLKSRDRAPEALYDVATAMREIGSGTEARALAEEAYGKAEDDATRQKVALLRAAAATDIDDSVTWLGRADPASPQVRASRSLALGAIARERGDDHEASARYLEAVAALAGMPESARTLEETSISWQGVYAVSGDRSALDRAVAPMERAIALDPTSAALRTSAARLLLEVALRDVLGDAVDVEAARLRTSLSTLGYLYRDEGSRRLVAERFLADPRCREAVTHLEQAVLVAPGNVGALTSLVAIRRVARDAAGLRALADGLKGRRVDLGDAKEKALAGYRGEEAKGARGTTEHAIERLKGRMDACRAKGGLTRALAAATLADLILAGATEGLEADIGEAARLAEEADAAAPSAATRELRVRVLLRRALLDLATARPDDAKRIDAILRVLGIQSAFAYLVGEGGPAAEAALALKDVQDALDLVAEDQKAFPLAPGGWEWAILKAGRPAVAATVAEAMAKDDLSRLMDEIQLAITPYYAETAYDAYWRHLAAGDEAGGRAILERCAAEGTPLPMPGK